LLKENTNDSGNPWNTIWLDPRTTIRTIVNENPQKSLLFLTLLGGIANTISYMSAAHLGDEFAISELFGLSVLIGPLSGVFAVFVGGWLLTHITKRLGGMATLAENRAALAWSWVPVVYLLPMWGVRFILFRNELFSVDKVFIESHAFFSTLWGFFEIYDFGISLWCLFILFTALSEVNYFSVWKGVASYFIMSLLFVLPMLILLYFFGPM